VTTLDTKKISELVTYWVHSASEDLATAEDIIAKTSRYVSGLFFLHLSLEKILKALYVKLHSTHAPFTHNLLSLLEKNQIQPSESDLRIFSEINEFNLEARYPDEKFRLQQIATQQFTSRYLQETKRLSLWISEKLNS